MNLDEARAILVEHSRSRSNGHFPDPFHLVGKLTNPICGDHVELRLRVVEGAIEAIGHKAQACAICSASASLICGVVLGLKTSTVLELADVFERAVSSPVEDGWPENLSEFRCFEHLRVNPSRKLCALLPWVAIRSALHQPTTFV